MPKPKKPKSDEADKAVRYIFDAMNNAFAEVKKTFTKTLSDPDTVGWMKLLELLEEAANDKEITASTEASAFIELSLKLIRGSSLGSSSDDVIQPLAPQFISANARVMSDKSHLLQRAMEAWIAEEWAISKAKNKSKRNFAKLYVPKLLNKFGKTVKERTISEIWLRKH